MGEAKVVWEGVLERSGVTLRKSLEDPVRNPPMAKYELRSTRDSAVPVRIVERIPANLDPENVGFVSSAGRTEGWRIDGAELVYGADLGPDESNRSAIAARGEDMDVIRDLAGDPQAFVVGDESPNRSSAVEPSREPADGGSAESEGVVTTLLAELRSGDVPAEDLAVLRRALDHETDHVGDEARIEQLQTDVADLRASRRVMENGLEAVENRLEMLERAGVNGNDDALTALREDVADLEHELYRFEKTMNAHTADIRSLERTVERLEGRLPEDLEAVGEFATAMRRAIEGVGEPGEFVEDDGSAEPDRK